MLSLTRMGVIYTALLLAYYHYWVMKSRKTLHKIMFCMPKYKHSIWRLHPVIHIIYSRVYSSTKRRSTCSEKVLSLKQDLWFPRWIDFIIFKALKRFRGVLVLIEKLSMSLGSFERKQFHYRFFCLSQYKVPRDRNCSPT